MTEGWKDLDHIPASEWEEWEDIEDGLIIMLTEEAWNRTEESAFRVLEVEAEVAHLRAGGDWKSYLPVESAYVDEMTAKADQAARFGLHLAMTVAQADVPGRGLEHWFALAMERAKLVPISAEARADCKARLHRAHVERKNFTHPKESAAMARSRKRADKPPTNPTREDWHEIGLKMREMVQTEPTDQLVRRLEVEEGPAVAGRTMCMLTVWEALNLGATVEYALILAEEAGKKFATSYLVKAAWVGCAVMARNDPAFIEAVEATMTSDDD